MFRPKITPRERREAMRRKAKQQNCQDTTIPQSNVLFGEGIDTKPYTSGFDANGQPIDIQFGTIEDLQKDENIEVLIVGGGWAGVQSLLTLRRAGVNAYLIEAQQELGGRVRSMEAQVGDKSVRLDSGAQYLGRDQRALWYLTNMVYKQFQLGSPIGVQDLCGRSPDAYPAPSNVEVLNFKRYEYPDPNTPELNVPPLSELPPWTPHFNPNASIPAVMPYTFSTLKDILPIETVISRIGFYNAIEDLNNVLGRLPQESPDQPEEYMYPTSIYPTLAQLDQISVSEWIDAQVAWYLPPHLRGLIEITVQAPLSVTSKEMSALAFCDYAKRNSSVLYLINDAAGGPQQYICKSSFQSVLNTLAAEEILKGRIIVGAPVKDISTPEGKDYVEGGVVTLLDGRQIKAKQISVMMSPNTVGRRISFGTNNELLSTQRNLYQTEGTVMGKTFKWFATYKKPFWREPGTYMVDGKEVKRPAYNGYVGTSGNTGAYNKKYSPFRLKPIGKPNAEPEGLCAEDDELNPANVIWMMDVSNDDEEVYTLMAFIVAEQIDKLVDENGDFDYAQARECCITHLYDFYKRFPDVEDDKELVEGSNLIKDFGGLWDCDGFIGGGPDAVEKPGVITNLVQYLDTQEKGNIPGTVRPLFFGGSEYARCFRGYMSGAVTNGLDTAIAIIDYLNTDPNRSTSDKFELSAFDKDFLNHQYYQQFETYDGLPPTGENEVVGFISFDPAMIGAYWLMKQFDQSIVELNILIGANTNPMSPDQSLSDFANLIDVITGLPNPGGPDPRAPQKSKPQPLHRLKWTPSHPTPLVFSLSNYEKGRLMMQYYQWGNLPAFLQFCNVDVKMTFSGIPTAELPFVGTFVGKWEILQNFGVIFSMFGDVVMPYKDYEQANKNEEMVIFYGTSIIVRPGMEYTPPETDEYGQPFLLGVSTDPRMMEYEPKIKRDPNNMPAWYAAWDEGMRQSRWIQIDTVNQVTFDNNTGYAKSLTIFNDNDSIARFLKTPYTPVPEKVRRAEPRIEFQL